MEYSLYDDGWGKFWSKPDNYKDPRQTEIIFFWPLTEQIPLDLDYTDCAAKETFTVLSTANTGLTWVTNAVTNMPSQLTINPINSVGQLNIGGVQIGLEKEPKWYQRVLYKILGFNWKDYK